MLVAVAGVTALGKSGGPAQTSVAIAGAGLEPRAGPDPPHYPRADPTPSSAPVEPSPSPSAPPAPTPAPAAVVVAGPSVPTGFVTRRGTQLLLNGQPYRFAGLNIYNATNTGSCWYVMGSGPRLDQALTAIGPGQRVFRAWFFQTMATTNGRRDWSAFDHTLAVARAHGERVIATLANQWGDCEAANNKNESWYQRGYRTNVDPSMLRSYRAWVAEVVARYRTSPTIMAWQLMNEAEDAVTIGGVCSSTAGQTLRAFAQDMANVVKGIDRYHLLSLGTIGNHCGTIGSNYSYVHSAVGIDLCEYHDYGSPSAPLPSALQTRINQCRALNKPLFVGETGIQVQQVGSVTNRAAAFSAKFAAQFRAGVVGELIWDWRDGDQDAYSGYELGPGDPALSLFGRYR